MIIHQFYYEIQDLVVFVLQEEKKVIVNTSK